MSLWTAGQPGPVLVVGWRDTNTVTLLNLFAGWSVSDVSCSDTARS